jgi:hypothetical protein
VDVGHDRITSSLGSRLALFASDFRLRRPRHRRRPLAGADSFFHNLVIHPENKYVTVLLLATPSVLEASASMRSMRNLLPLSSSRSWLLHDGVYGTRRAPRRLATSSPAQRRDMTLPWFTGPPRFSFTPGEVAAVARNSLCFSFRFHASRTWVVVATRMDWMEHRILLVKSRC